MNVIPAVGQQLGESIGGVLDGLRGAFDFVSGVNDVIVVRHPDGSVYCSTFCVQTNASTVNRHMLGQDVAFELNGKPTGLPMYVADDGRCLFRDHTGDGTVPDLSALARVQMRDGRNAMDFRIGDAIVASAGLFAWGAADWVIIVDIDGTITQTDVGGVVTTSELGQQLLGQQLGVTHAHADVCEAMSLLACAGYRLLFLTARPITRSHATRRYLASIGRAGGGARMPEGALVTSPKGTLGTIAAVWGDVKTYKLRALVEIQALFTPPNARSASTWPGGGDGGGGGGGGGGGRCNFAGGFGNHDYDAHAYIEAGCPPGRVFIIDEDSDIRVPGTDVVYRGYTGLIPFLPDLFPPVVVVQWERAKANGSFRTAPPNSSAPGGSPYSSGSPYSPFPHGGGGGGATWSPSGPLSGGEGGGGPRHVLSLNKIPGVALLGEGLGKVWGAVQSPPASFSRTAPVAGGERYRAPAYRDAAAGGGDVAPPAYDSPEGQGLIDLGADGLGPLES